ncbi:MAG: hypothetical protein ACJARL_003041 [Halopseudomonas sp.]|jgi:hypothetical protein
MTRMAKMGRCRNGAVEREWQKKTDIPKYVIPAKAGIQAVSEVPEPFQPTTTTGL